LALLLSDVDGLGRRMPKMADAIFLRLNQKFALGADDLQWILYKSRRKDPSPLEAHLVFGRGGEWEPVRSVCHGGIARRVEGCCRGAGESYRGR
jgi:hypothetical protein